MIVLGMDTRGVSTGAAAATSKVSQLSIGVQKGLGVAVPLAAAAGATAVVKFGVDAVRAATAAQESHLMLANTFENNAMLSDRSVESFEAQADAIMKLTGVDDELIKSSQAVLGQFDLTGQQVERLTPLIVDLSAKMGIDLAAAAKAVGKAATGNVGILARYGIAVEAADSASGQFANTLDALGKVQGYAASRAEEQPWRLLSAQFGELQEQIGTALLPTLTSFAQGLISVVQTLQPLLDLLGRLGPVVEIAAKAFGILMSPLTFVITKFHEIVGIGIGDELAGVAAHAIEVSGALDQTASSSTGALQPLDDMGDRLRKLVGRYNEATTATHTFANMTREELKDFRADAISSLGDATGSLTEFRRGWELTSGQAVRNMEGMANRAKQMARDFRALDQSAIPERFKAFLIQEGPEAVRAFVRGNESQQGRFKAAWRVYEQHTQASVRAIKAITAPGGTEAGKGLVAGFIAGIQSMAGAAEAAARAMAQRAVSAVEQELDEHSPSRVTRELGLNFTLGFAQGVLAGVTDLVSAISEAVGEGMSKARLLQAKELEAMASDVVERIEKLGDRIQSFRERIQSGFDIDLIGGLMGLEELNPATAAEFLSAQFEAAAKFADALEQLQAAGLGRNALAELASQGPGALPAAQLLLGSPELLEQFNATQEGISQFADQATRHLVDEIFGEAIERAANRVNQLAEAIDDFLEELRGAGHGSVLQDLNIPGITGGGPHRPPVEIHLHGDAANLIDRVDEGLAVKGRHNVRLVHHS